MDRRPSLLAVARCWQGLVSLAVLACAVFALLYADPCPDEEGKVMFPSLGGTVHRVLAAQWQEPDEASDPLGAYPVFLRWVAAGVQPAVALRMSRSVASGSPAEVRLCAQQCAEIDTVLRHWMESERQDRPPRRAASPTRQRFHPFPFDPNTVDSAGLVQLGFTPRQARGIVRYRVNGGVFRRAEDFGRLRVVDSAAWAALGSYVRIEAQSSFYKEEGLAGTRFHPFPFDPNTIDSAGLVQLGFTPRQARGIVRYRASGGTFRKAEDFGRLRVVDSAAWAALSPYVRIEAQSSFYKEEGLAGARFHPMPFDPNTVDSAGLVQLGFTPRQARGIVRYRANGGVFRRAEDFGRLRVVDSAAYEALRGYIRIGK